MSISVLGGVLSIADWHDDDQIVLQGWPGMPMAGAEAGRVILWLGLSFIELQGRTDCSAILARVRLDG